MNDFLNSLRRAGKSELTVKQYENTLIRFTGWLSDDPYPTPRNPKRVGGKALIFTHKILISRIPAILGKDPTPTNITQAKKERV